MEGIRYPCLHLKISIPAWQGGGLALPLSQRMRDYINAQNVRFVCGSTYIVTFHYGLLSRQNKTLYALFFCYHDVIQLEKVLDGTLKGLLEES